MRDLDGSKRRLNYRPYRLWRRWIIAVVAVMLGQANPPGVLGAGVLFGFADAIGFNLQGNLPSELTGAIPYLATLVALAIYQFRRRRVPSGCRSAGTTLEGS